MLSTGDLQAPRSRVAPTRLLPWIRKDFWTALYLAPAFLGMSTNWLLYWVAPKRVMTYLTQVRLLDTVPELLILLTLESVIFTHSIDILKVGGYPEHPCRAGTELSTKAKWGTWQNIELHRFVRKFVYWVRRLFFLGWHVYFLGWTPLRDPPPPPNTPSSAPTQTKRVPIHSFLKQASICILIKTWNWSIAELWGKNWDTDAHAHVTYQAPITGLHSPT